MKPSLRPVQRAHALILMGWLWVGLGMTPGDAAEPATPLLGLTHANAAVRRETLKAWRLVPSTDSIPAVIALLKDVDPAIAREAASALGEQSHPAVVPALLDALRDRRPAVRQQAIHALGQRGDRRATPALISLAAHDAFGGNRQSALYALGQLNDPSAYDVVIASLSLKETGPSAVDALIHWGELGVPGLMLALSVKSSHVQVQAAKALRAFPTPDVAQALTRALSTASAESLFEISKALGSLGTVALSGLARAAEDRSVTVRASAMRALGWMEEETGVWPLFNRGVEDPEATVRAAAIGSVNRWGVQGLSLLVRGAADADRQVRQQATDALCALRREGIPGLVLVMADRDKGIRQQAAFTILHADPCPYLLEHLDDPRGVVRTAAIKGCGQQRCTRAVPRLRDLFQETSSLIRREVVIALGEIGDRTAIDLLKGALEDPDRNVRVAAEAALKQWGEDDANLFQRRVP